MRWVGHELALYCRTNVDWIVPVNELVSYDQNKGTWQIIEMLSYNQMSCTLKPTEIKESMDVKKKVSSTIHHKNNSARYIWLF